jgi:hypothetical protein
MQLAAAGLLAIEAVFWVLSNLIFINHDTVKQALQAAGTQIPQGMSEEQLINLTVAGIIGFAVVVAVLELFGALGAFLGWRWVFWYVLVLMALGGLNAIFNIASLVRPRTSATQFPVWNAAIQELLCLGAVAMFVWMVIGAVRYGPWAMKRPGS